MLVSISVSISSISGRAGAGRGGVGGGGTPGKVERRSRDGLMTLRRSMGDRGMV